MKQVIVIILLIIGLFIISYFGVALAVNMIMKDYKEPETFGIVTSGLQHIDEIEIKTDIKTIEQLPLIKSNVIVNDIGLNKSEQKNDVKQLVKIPPQGCPYAEMMTIDDVKCVLSY